MYFDMLITQDIECQGTNDVANNRGC